MPIDVPFTAGHPVAGATGLNALRDYRLSTGILLTGTLTVIDGIGV
jgi:hypothetical protein